VRDTTGAERPCLELLGVYLAACAYSSWPYQVDGRTDGTAPDSASPGPDQARGRTHAPPPVEVIEEGLTTKLLDRRYPIMLLAISNRLISKTLLFAQPLKV